MFGIINVYKEKGMTSFDVIAKLRKILHEKKIGHTGTLDPNATGVLPICVGNATKLVQYIINEDKKYIAKIKLGVQTDSLDITGNILKKEEPKKLTQKAVEKVCLAMVGINEQIPPMYSAKKYNGKKLYELARQGKDIERKPNKIEIYSINDIEYSNISDTISFCVHCSKGTYIRTLCEDILEKLNCLGTLAELERIQTGIFGKSNSLTLTQIEDKVNEKNIEDILYNAEEIFAKYDKLILNENEYKMFLNGVKLNIQIPNGIYIIYCNNKFIGIGECLNNKLKRKVVL